MVAGTKIYSFGGSWLAPTIVVAYFVFTNLATYIPHTSLATFLSRRLLRNLGWAWQGSKRPLGEFCNISTVAVSDALSGYECCICMYYSIHFYTNEIHTAVPWFLACLNPQIGSVPKASWRFAGFWDRAGALFRNIRG
nr:hypothetical protein CFP56_00484 [Quercus suber]